MKALGLWPVHGGLCLQGTTFGPDSFPHGPNGLEGLDAIESEVFCLACARGQNLDCRPVGQARVAKLRSLSIVQGRAGMWATSPLQVPLLSEALEVGHSEIWH